MHSHPFLRCLLFGFFVQVSAWAGAFEPSGKWDRPEVSVCWMDAVEFKKNPELLDDSLYFNEGNLFFAAEIASAIQARIESEFTHEKTGVHFTGFEKCRISGIGGKPAADAILALERVAEFDEIIEGGSSIGLSVVDLFEGAIVRRDPEEPGMPSLVIQIPAQDLYRSKIFGLNEAITLTALHEFGHLAGLHHEHAAYLDEAGSDPYCLNSPFSSELKREPDQGLTLVPQKYTENLFYLKGAIRSGYDSRSIMSYCHTRMLFAFGGRISLSSGDRAILKSMYSR